jgi:3-oxoadipate enol-lactonase
VPPVDEPPLPLGRRLELPGRGTTFVREVAAGPSAPTLVLLHGWTATAELNWVACFGALGRAGFRVLAIDHRGHGRGIRSRRRFRLEDCADDVAALLDVLGIASAIPVGYSMGGPIAQLVWRRHPDRVDGLVLCATSRNFRGSGAARMMFAGMAGLATMSRLTPPPVTRAVARRVRVARPDEGRYAAWMRRETSRGNATKLLEAGAALGEFSSHPWIGEVDVPTAVVITMQDGVVPPPRQRRLAESIPGATVHPVAGDHTVCVSDPGAFVPALVGACRSVSSRAGVVLTPR